MVEDMFGRNRHMFGEVVGQTFLACEFASRLIGIYQKHNYGLRVLRLDNWLHRRHTLAEES